ncbi:MAG: hypothetical protein M1815_003794 [Lichina confinis]|nr:MAG: hypothetical protein M1815_003794 [Lichina confinis]
MMHRAQISRASSSALGPPRAEFVSFVPPPGEAITGYGSNQPEVPADFAACMSVRHHVFVQEQRIPDENELDGDDPRSFHWIAYASVASVVREGGRKGTETHKIPVATVRLVPPPHPPHPTPGGEYTIDDVNNRPTSEGGDRKTRFHDGLEPYAKLGRLATLPAYRGLGIGRLLVESALEWANQHPLSILPLPSATSTEAAKIWGGTGEKQEWKGLVLAHAQKRTESVWRRYGFERDEDMGVWIEEGIEHIGMWKRIPVQKEKYVFR